MPLSPMAVLVAVVGLVGLIAPFVGLTIVSIRRDEHSPKALRDDR